MIYVDIGNLTLDELSQLMFEIELRERQKRSTSTKRVVLNLSFCTLFNMLDFLTIGEKGCQRLIKTDFSNLYEINLSNNHLIAEKISLEIKDVGYRQNGQPRAHEFK